MTRHRSRTPIFFRTALYLHLFLFAVLPAAHGRTDYAISLANPELHLVEVQITLPQGSPQRDLQLPVWNALYQVRDFAQYVNWVRAKDANGRLLPIKKINKSLWQLSGASAGALIEYQIYLDSFGPFGAQLNLHHAFLNLAQLLMYPIDARNDPITLHFNHIPQEWQIATPLTNASSGNFSAENYDRLVDSPVEIGTFKQSDFDENGAHYSVVVDADSADYNMPAITAMLQEIVGSATAWMNDRPFERYMFIFHFPRGPTGGGMEHSYSTAIDVNAEVLSQSPEVLASVAAHEFFHLWNVKRIRPQTLEPVDYTKENYTRALWFSEGCTSTAADFILLRAGLLNEKQFERQLASGIAELERRPARLTQSAEESSLDAWLEGDQYYRRPERSISYYDKGELLGVLLDLALRDATQGSDSLRELFQWMNQHYAKQKQFFPDSLGVRESAEAVAHADLGWFFEKYVAGTDEIPWDDLFRGVGLRLVGDKISTADPGFEASRNFDGPMKVSSVTPGSPADHAGLRVGDTILEINGKAVGQESSEQVSGLAGGDKITVKVRGKRGAETELKWEVGNREEVTYELKDVEKPTPAQLSRRSAWLKGEAQSPQAALHQPTESVGSH